MRKLQAYKFKALFNLILSASIEVLLMSSNSFAGMPDDNVQKQNRRHKPMLIQGYQNNGPYINLNIGMAHLHSKTQANHDPEFNHSKATEDYFLSDNNIAGDIRYGWNFEVT